MKGKKLLTKICAFNIGIFVTIPSNHIEDAFYEGFGLLEVDEVEAKLEDPTSTRGLVIGGPEFPTTDNGDPCRLRVRGAGLGRYAPP
ncbi:unnamed protein product [Schistocephalus solidus]|uniref:RRM domain-containing protein n=1 Tax=Schistocephalus solidus TaxID=70667 RepID=A0A183T4M8_SCHSO|nr:unnamed protein product [Schistocephalus solidus]